MLSSKTTFSAGKMPVELYTGDAIEWLQGMRPGTVDVVVADPPYFLSGKGSTCKSGKRTAVRKGRWDVPITPDQQYVFALRWLDACCRLLTPQGSLFVCGTSHGIHRVHRAAVDGLGCHLINDIQWVKRNPPPQLACRALTHASETILWMRPPGRNRRHFFNYRGSRKVTGVQMRSVWTDILAPSREERLRAGAKLKGRKLVGGHPTQKPVELLARMLMIACPKGGVALDPFLGSGTALEAAMLHGCGRFIGIDIDRGYIDLAHARAMLVEQARAA